MENQKEFLNEENYQKANSKVKWGGRIAMLIGISMILIGAFVVKVPDMGTDGWFEAESTRNFLIFPGVFITLVGCMIRFVVANQRNITAYQTQQMRPIAQEGIEKMSPSMGVAAKEITKGIKDGFAEVNEVKYCKYCGKRIDEDSKFCKECGKEQ